MITKEKMFMEIKVSIIMGVFNSQSEKKLRNSIESILNQTFKNFEFIICDDCSTKEFVKNVLDYYAQKDNRIVYIKNNENKGLAFSLNHCLKYAKGEYIARQDDDDISLPNRIEEEVKILDKNYNISIVGCNMWLYDDNGIYGKTNLIELPQKENLLYGCPFAHPTIMLRKKALDIVGNYSIDPIIRRIEDYDLYFKLLFNGLWGINLNSKLYIYSEDYYTLQKQKFKYRIDEFKLRKKWFKKLKMFPRGIAYLFKPVISGLIPNKIRFYFKRKKFKLNDEDIKIINDLKLNNYIDLN